MTDAHSWLVFLSLAAIGAAMLVAFCIEDRP
jgi:hypothetical protein